MFAKTRYEGGLGKLDNTNQQVKEMQETLKFLQPMLVTAAGEVQQILAHVEQESAAVAEVEKVVRVDEEAAQVSQKRTASLQPEQINLLNYIRKWRRARLR